MFAGLLIESNIKNGGFLMWMELYLSTIKIHPDFLWPDVGENCRHGGEQCKLLITWYRTLIKLLPNAWFRCGSNAGDLWKGRYRWCTLFSFGTFCQNLIEQDGIWNLCRLNYIIANIRIATNLCVTEYVYCRVLNLPNGLCRGTSSLFRIVFFALAESYFPCSYERSLKVLNIGEGEFWLHLKGDKLFN